MDQALIQISTIQKFPALSTLKINLDRLIWIFIVETFNFLFNLLLLDITFPTTFKKETFDYKYRYDAILIRLISVRFRLYHVTSILHCHWKEFWSRDTDVYMFWYYFDIVVCQFLETGTPDRFLIGIVQLLRFSLYTPFHFFFTVPWKVISLFQRFCSCVVKQKTENIDLHVKGSVDEILSN